MRLPVTPKFASRDGVSAKDARLTNALMEQRLQTPIACKRPALELAANPTVEAAGNGLVCFDGTLVGVVGGQLFGGYTTTTDVEMEDSTTALPSSSSFARIGAYYYAFTGYQATSGFCTAYGIYKSLDGVAWAPVSGSLGMRMAQVAPSVIGDTVDTLMRNYTLVGSTCTAGGYYWATVANGEATFAPVTTTAFRTLVYNSPYYYGITSDYRNGWGGIGWYTVFARRMVGSDVVEVGTTVPSDMRLPPESGLYYFKGKVISVGTYGLSPNLKAGVMVSEDGLTYAAPQYLPNGVLENTCLGAGVLGDYFYCATRAGLYRTSDGTVYTLLTAANTGPTAEFSGLASASNFFVDYVSSKLFTYIAPLWQYAPDGMSIVELTPHYLGRSSDGVTWEWATIQEPAGQCLRGILQRYAHAAGAVACRWSANLSVSSPIYDNGVLLLSAPNTVGSLTPITTVPNTLYDYTLGAP
jgi:hypothetical protein